MSSIVFERIKKIADLFSINGNVIDIQRFGSGHINDTFKIFIQDEAGDSYLIQRINHHIFADVKGLMNNIDVVTRHLQSIFQEQGLDCKKHTLTIIPTKKGELYCQDEEGSYWRVFILLEGTKSYDIVETTKQSYSGGQAFGKFQKQLATLDASKLVEILPNFHNIDFRMHNLREAITANKANRVNEVKDILEYIFAREEGMRNIIKMAQQKELPLRITHNDTKFNNVLLDADDNVQCVIDLDTVMPGYIAYDFGDAIRTIINSAAEDEKQLDKVVLNIPLFEAYAEGYMSEAKAFLTDKEVESLWYGVLLLPYMQAVRFLSDYIDGDLYYKTQYIDHNLVRTKTQIKLVQELEAHETELLSILEKAA